MGSVAALRSGSGRTLLAPTPGTADPVDGGQARGLVVFRSQRSLSGCRGRKRVTGSKVFVPGKQDRRRGTVVWTSSRLWRRRWDFESLDLRQRKSINGSWRSTTQQHGSSGSYRLIQVARGGRAIMLAPHFTCESRAQLPRRPELHHSHSRPQLVEQAWQGQMRM